jgi:hypothetical protein
MLTRYALLGTALALAFSTYAHAASPNAPSTPAALNTPPESASTPPKAPNAASPGSQQVPDLQGQTPSNGPSSANTPANPESLVGYDVTDSHNEKVGKIDDIVLGQDGRIRQVIVSVGGFLGIGAKNVAVDWGKVHMDASRKVASLDMTKEELKAAPDAKGSSSSDKPAAPSSQTLRAA